MAASLVPTEGGSPIALDKPIILIGRHQECDITLLTSPKVSRRHCCIVQVGERYVLRDLGSMNGMRVNGHRIVETELYPGDELSVADTTFTFCRDDMPARAAKPVRAARDVEVAAVGDQGRNTPEAVPIEDDPVYDLASDMDEDIDVRIKDDSHSAEHGFVAV